MMLSHRKGAVSVQLGGRDGSVSKSIVLNAVSLYSSGNPGVASSRPVSMRVSLSVLAAVGSLRRALLRASGFHHLTARR